MINIEICKSWKKGKWNIRIGDIEGSEECSQMTKEEVMEIIKEKLK